MLQIRNDPARGGAGVHFAGERRAYTTTDASTQADSLVSEGMKFLGWPRVDVDVVGSSVFVRLLRRPWGWANPDREFLGGRGAADRYAADLRTRIKRAARREGERRERLRRARKAERDLRRREAEGVKRRLPEIGQ